MSTDQSSLGPALVGNISVDSLDDSQPHQHQQQQQQDQASAALELTFDATSSPIAHATGAQPTGGDTSSFDHDNYVSFGPTMREAEEFADQMTSEILEQVQANSEKEPEADQEPQYQQQEEQHSPVIQRKSSNSMATQASSSYSPGSGVAAPPDLSAVKNILISAYSNVAHVFHWRRPIESGVIFTIGLILITALTFFSIISVVAYTALGCIMASGMLRVYKTSMKALNRSPGTPVDHIWEKVLSVDVSMSPERLHELVESSHANLNASLVYFKQVLLVEDKIATTKFFLFLYSLTYIGSWFNGLTLITIIYLALFSVPKLYESNKTKIDDCLNLATEQISSAMDSVTSKFGGGSKKQN